MRFTNTGKATTVVVTAVAAAALGSGVASAGPEHHHTDPQATGCANDAITIRSGSIGGIGYEIRYSNSCGTNWVRVPALNGTVHMLINSDYDGSGPVGGTQTGSGGSHWTPQVYAPGATCITYWVQDLGAAGQPATGNVRVC